jgi:hypothetical protein
MTINTTLCRRTAACLVASVALVVAVAWAAADAPARSQDREASAVPLARESSLAGRWVGRCERGYVCLYQDADGHGRRIRFNKPGTYKLKNYSMGPGKRGVSSFWNRRFGKQARLGLPNIRFTLRSHANVRRSVNDQATIVVLDR